VTAAARGADGLHHARPGVLPVLAAAHIGPTVAVTAITALLAASGELGLGTGALVTLAVLAGQLTIGWGNDLLDAARDREVGRRDKPLADGRVSPALVRRCLVAAGAACVVLSLAAGWRSGLVHLVCLVGGGHAYNFGLKSTAWSWTPYAVAFGSLPAVVTLAGSTPAAPPAWAVVVAAMLGVGAHLLNALPDFADDAATGVKGLPHRLGATATRIGATTLLVAASVVAVLGPPEAPTGRSWAALGLVAALAVVTLVGRGKVPFAAAVAIALVDVVLLTVSR
jgi:4-hydroxybenzoate polyprenyltransferase